MKLQTALIALFFVLTPLLGCGGPAEFAVVGSARAPSADGRIVLERIEGGNSLVTVTMHHLPPPDRLGQSLTAYVVWFTPSGGSPQKVAVLEYDPEERVGTARATSTAGRFEVRITAERNRNVSAPSDVVVAMRRIGSAN